MHKPGFSLSSAQISRQGISLFLAVLCSLFFIVLIFAQVPCQCMKLVPHPFFFSFSHKSITAVFKKKKLSLMSLWGSTRGTEVRVNSAEDPGLSFKGPLFYARSTYNYSTNDNGITQSDAKLLHLGWISVCVGGRVGGWRRTWGWGGGGHEYMYTCIIPCITWTWIAYAM